MQFKTGDIVTVRWPWSGGQPWVGKVDGWRECGYSVIDDSGFKWDCRPDELSPYTTPPLCSWRNPGWEERAKESETKVVT